MSGYSTTAHMRWLRDRAPGDDPERAAIRKRLAFGLAVYDCRIERALSVKRLAALAGMEPDEIERIEEGGTEPSLELIERLAEALHAEVRLTPGPSPAIRFEPPAA
ncbi:helix-turn-helix domain-containing protein [Streptomyces fradiae]|uniref:helix-turn-helix domain-containing protein n=1 Tax=Streptomyces fradiae TaxID=1906 RepID=UPI003512700D